MEFSKMRHRIVFLKPVTAETNNTDENVIGWYPYHPITDITSDKMYVSQDNECIFDEGVLYTFSELMHDYGIWACVAPMTGKEYAEAQKIRAETTYNINTRYIKNITGDMKILYGAKVFDVWSVLDIGGSKRELKIVAIEADSYGKK